MASFRRNKRNVNNCPKCGVFVCPGYQNRTELPEEFENHQCDPEFVKRSNKMCDVVMDRDHDYDEPRTRTIAERLAEGFEMMEEEDRFGDDDA